MRSSLLTRKTFCSQESAGPFCSCVVGSSVGRDGGRPWRVGSLLFCVLCLPPRLLPACWLRDEAKQGLQKEQHLSPQRD